MMFGVCGLFLEAAEAANDYAAEMAAMQEVEQQSVAVNEMSSDEESYDSVVENTSHYADMDDTANDNFDIENMYSQETETVGGFFSPILRIFDDLWYEVFRGQDDIVTKNHFSDDGTYDHKNNLIVEGNVAHDMQYTENQTHGSCSLMAQEQFVHRYYGEEIPESELEEIAQKIGIYNPNEGTYGWGFASILDICHVPHQRLYDQDIKALDKAISENKDILISVDTRTFYNDNGFPPGSGHAVAVVGRGIDPTTHETRGYYVTDTNFGGAAHFVPVERMNDSLLSYNFITIPEVENSFGIA